MGGHIMGIDCKAYIKPVARIEDIFKTAAILLGAEKVIRNSDNNEYQVLDLKPDAFKVSIGSLSTYENNYISNYDSFMSLIVSDRFGNNDMFFIQPQNNSKGEMYFSARSTPIAIALASKLIDIFGGKLYSSDADMNLDKEVMTGVWKTKFTDNEDQGFIAKNKFLINLKTLSPQDIKDAQKICGYTYDNDEINELSDRFRKYAPVELATKLEKTLEGKAYVKKKKI